MGISTAGHLPSITSTSYPALTSHLQSAYNAQKVGNWTVSVRVLRSILSLENQDGRDGNPQAKAKLMYIVQMSEFPNDTFILIEDSQRETRASIRAKHAMSVMQAAAVAAVSSSSQENNAISQQTDMEAETQNGIDDRPIDSIQTEKQESGEEDVKMGDAKQDEQPEEEKEEESKKEVKSATDTQDDQDHSVDVPPSAEELDDLFSDPPNSSETQHAEQIKTKQVEPENSSPQILPTSDFDYVSERPTRHTLFAASAQYLLLLSRLNLPAPLGAPSIGDGVITAAHAGPGAWIPRGAPVSVQGATYDIPSATGYGSGGAEWRVRLGMVQSTGTRSAGALVESEYLPILRLASDTFLSNYLHNLFPSYLTTPSHSVTQQAVNSLLQTGVIHSAPTPEQWQEVIPASNQAWMESVGISSTTNNEGLKEAQRLPLQQKDRIGWQGKERGRRLAYLYITLLRNQSVI